MRKYLFLLILGLMGYLNTSPAQTDNSIENISVSQGLPNSQVTQLFLNQNGLMWIGTSNGLCVYDGYRFVVKQAVPFDSTTLADDNIVRIAQDCNSNIWILTHYGIEFINASNMANKRVKYLSDYSEVIDLIPSSYNNSLYVIYKNKIQKIDINTLKQDKDIVPIDFQIKAAIPSVGFIYLMNAENIARLNLMNGNIEKLHLGIEIKDSSSPVCLNTYDSKNLVFAVGKKLYLFNINSLETKLITTFDDEILRITRQYNNKIAVSTKKSISLIIEDADYNLVETLRLYSAQDIVINSLIQDSNNIIFIATNKGVIKINPHSRLIQHQSFSDAGIDQNYINEIIIESSQKGYLIKSNANNYIFCNAINSNKYSFEFIRTPTSCLLADNILYIGSDAGLYSFNLNFQSIEAITGLEKETVIHSIKQFNDEIFVATNKGLYLGSDNGFKKICEDEIFKFIVTEKELFYTNNKGFSVLDRTRCKSELLLNQSNSNEFLKILDILQSFDGKIWLATEDGLYKFNPETAIDQDQLFSLVFKGKVYSLIEADNLPEIWFATDNGIGSINYQSERVMLLGYEDGIRETSFIECGAFLGPAGEINFLSNNEIINFVPGLVFRNKKIPDIAISHANFLGKDKSEHSLILPGDTIIISPEIRILELSFTTSDFFSPLHAQFEYCLDKKQKSSAWEALQGNVLSIAGLPSGTYEIKVRAKNSHGIDSSGIKKFVLIVKAPLFESRTAYLLYLISLVFLVFSFIRFRTRNLMRINREYKEKERIAKKIEQQKEELSTKNKNITDSINYARRIQLAMMPSIKHFKVLFHDSFILHMPKDIVSGDFYWVNHVENKIFLSAVDCTGHGVPGAFMSIIGVELFRRITEIEKIYTPADVLNSLSKNFERVFGDVDEMKLRDGMDLAFCSINSDQTVLEFSGAFNPLYIIRDSSIIEVKGDRQSVGYHDEDEVHSFTNHVIPLQDGDLIYIFTDGFVDQFGGPEGKKYKYRRFRHLLLALQQLPMNKQEEYLKKSILEWKGESDQVDDILVIGLRIHQNKG
jgi:serine phosphatase RsbU (regulator of sigma subunit)